MNATATEQIFRSTHPDGLAARVTEFEDHYSVTLVDLESGMVIPEARLFPKTMKDEAVSYAISCAG